MIKKIFRVFALFLFAQVVLFSCCKDEENVILSNFFLENVYTSSDGSTTITPENYRLYLRTNFTIAHSWKKELIPNAAYAIYCDPNYNVRNKITNINITSNTELAGIAAGETINNLFVYQEFFEDEVFFEIDSFVDNINDGIENDFFFAFINPDEIPAETSATFTVVITLEDDTQITETSEVITFE